MQYLKNPCSITNDRYKTFKNKLNHLIRISHKHYINNYLNNHYNDLKKSWELINNLLQRKSKPELPKKFIIDNESITDPNKIANKFNDFFTTIGSNLASKIKKSSTSPVSFMKHRCPHSLFLNLVTEYEVIKIINNLKHTVAGFDGINSVVLKHVFSEIMKPMLYLLNLSFTQGEFPDKLKVAVITPIYKKGIREDISNYRPVSVLPIFSKIFEKIMYNRLISFLEKNNILYNNQYGFRSGYSTDTALIYVTENILKALNEKQHVAGVFMDLAKAYDTINHKLLLQKLEYYGVRGVGYKWFCNYFQNRSQQVKYNASLSNFTKITCGIPQGSILGPLMFILYVNDLYLVSDKVEFVLFADDTNIFIKGHHFKDTIMQLNNVLEKVATWFQVNQLSLNISKTHYMIFSSRKFQCHPDVSVKINNISLQRVISTSFLGVEIDSQLTWKNHVSKINSKLCKSIGILHRVKTFLSKHWRLKLYNTFVLPYLNYCNIVWASANDSTLKPLIISQKRALKMVLDVPRTYSTKQVFTESGAFTIADIHKIQTGIFMHKYEHNILPSSFNHKYILNSGRHGYETRTSSNYYIPKPRIEKFKYSLAYRGPYIWNNLPQSLKLINNLDSFKRKLKSFYRNVY